MMTRGGVCYAGVVIVERNLLEKYQEVWGFCKPALLRYFCRRFQPGSRILDLGCGSGGYVAALRKQGFEAIGVDIDASRFVGQKEHFVKACAEKLPFDNGSFDHALAINVIEHVDDRKSVAELKRVVRGIICGTVPARESNSTIADYGLTYHAYVDPTHKCHYTDRQLRELFESQGFRIVEIRYTTPANVVGAALCAARFPRRFAERLGDLLNRGPLLKKCFTTVLFVAENIA